MERDEIKVFLEDLYLDATKEEFDFIVEEFSGIAKAVSYFSEIDTSEVEEISWPFKISSSYLRDDIVDHTLSNEEALQNAKDVQNGYVKYIKVV